MQLDQPAQAFWITAGPQRRSFDSIPEAARFVMEELAEPHRASAWITLTEGSLTNNQIKQFYEKHRPAKS
jgi:hypothetical protein